jgi:hypothetical protein
LGRNVEVKVIVSFGGLHEKHAVQRGVLGTNSAFALGPRKSTKNLNHTEHADKSVPQRKHITSQLQSPTG